MPPDWVIAGLVGIVLSIALLGFGIPLYQRKYELKGWLGLLMVTVGGFGLVASVGWLIVRTFVEAKLRSE